MPNMKQILTAHNKTILEKRSTDNDNTRMCNCRKKDECPMDRKCLETSIVYQATVTDQNKKIETYVGLTAITFKTTFTAHKSSFNNTHKRHETALSKHIWKLKDKNVNFNITWKKIKSAKVFNTSNKKCLLCQEERFYIVRKPNMATLNKRREIFTPCMHRKKHLLINAHSNTNTEHKSKQDRRRSAEEPKGRNC